MNRSTPTPKYRPSFSLDQLLAIKQAIEIFKSQHEAPLAMLEVESSVSVFLAKINYGAKQPAYVQTKAAPKPVSLEDLGESAEALPKLTFTTIEDCRKAFISVQTIYKPMGFPAPEDLQKASVAWTNYCTENDFDPMKEAGLETGED